MTSECCFVSICGFPIVCGGFKGDLAAMARGGPGAKSYMANPAKYKLLEEVGHGASATVYRAIYLPFNEVVAVKCLDLDRCNSNLVSIADFTRFCFSTYVEDCGMHNWL